MVRPSQFADIQINAAMALAKKAGLPPRDAAARIVDALNLDGICTSVEISGPGFINLSFDGTWIEELLNAESVQAASPATAVTPAATPQRVVVDYSSPNVAKEMHVGHLRTTVVGDSLVKVLEALGDTVIRQNHIGDWGTPFGMLIEHWLEIGEDSPEAALLVEDPSAFYQAARAKFDASATDEDGFATRARLASLPCRAATRRPSPSGSGWSPSPSATSTPSTPPWASALPMTTSPAKAPTTRIWHSCARNSRNAASPGSATAPCAPSPQDLPAATGSRCR